MLDTVPDKSRLRLRRSRTSGSSRRSSPASSGPTSRSTAATSGSTPGSPARSSSAKHDFTGPAIGILGATQLNGGAVGTAIVLAVARPPAPDGLRVFPALRRLPWAQAWWALTYYNAWLMTVNDDPFVWFYYIYGFTTLPPIAFLWVVQRALGAATPRSAAAATVDPRHADDRPRRPARRRPR